jgi:adenylate cyclase
MSTAFSYATEGRQRRQIKQMFSRYMSDLLIQDLLKNPDKLRLGGEKRVLTVFFSDLAGFTSLSEKLSPEEVVALLNRYLTAMTDIILRSGGLIDKYEGDAIMAFWGAPVFQEDHAVRACLAALDNQSRLGELRQEFLQAGLPPIHARIGINTGEMIEELERQGDWLRVSYKGAEGWLHFSAVQEQQFGLSSLSGERAQESTKEEVALAGKGFTPEVEKAFRDKNSRMRYDLVNQVQSFKINETQMLDFIRAGNLKEPGGAP